MATTRALAAEDKDLSTVSIVTARNKVFSDIDLTFTNKPSGDIYKKTDAAAVKQAVKNLLMTNILDRPFDSNFGGNLNNLLFELADDDVEEEIKDRIINVIEIYEPRAVIIDLVVTFEDHDVNVYLEFGIKNINETTSFTTSLSRLR